MRTFLLAIATGPFRGGKATSASGVPGNPAIYYVGTAGSGLWKTVVARF